MQIELLVFMAMDIYDVFKNLKSDYPDEVNPKWDFVDCVTWVKSKDYITLHEANTKLSTDAQPCYLTERNLVTIKPFTSIGLDLRYAQFMKAIKSCNLLDP